jgi:Opioid growth factor receptor (OGFr) conserved region
MSLLVHFYRGEGTDAEGRRLQELWGWSDEDLEEVHDFVQWLFPLPEPSRYNPDAPLLTDEDVAAFRADERLQENLRKSFRRFLTFLGLAATNAGDVVEAPNFSARVPDVWAVPNHNWLRITRVLRSLKVLGLEREAQALYDRLHALYSSRRFPITEDTIQFWTEAVEGLPFHAGAGIGIMHDEVLPNDVADLRGNHRCWRTPCGNESSGSCSSPAASVASGRSPNNRECGQLSQVTKPASHAWPFLPTVEPWRPGLTTRP